MHQKSNVTKIVFSATDIYCSNTVQGGFKLNGNYEAHPEGNGIYTLAGLGNNQTLSDGHGARVHIEFDPDGSIVKVS